MKLRVRFQRIRKVVVVEESRENDICIGDIKQEAARLFDTEFDDDFYLSLNNKDGLDDDALLSSCDVVSGDLMHILSKSNQHHAAAPNTNKPSLLSSTDSFKSTRESSTNNRNPDHMPMDTGQEEPGPSYAYNPMAGTSEYQLDQEDPVDHTIVKQCLSEPVLCRECSEGNVPALLREVYAACEPDNEIEAMCVVLHVLMLETGFIVSTENTNNGSSSIPDRWRFPAYYKFTYTYTGCNDHTVSLTVITTGTSLAVHGKVVGDNSATRMCSIRPIDYIKTVSSDPSRCYRHLTRLNMVFKDTVANPLVQDIRTAAGLEDVFGLMALTQELKLRILSYLDVRTLLRASLVCSEMADISKDPYLWRRLYMKDFGNRRDNSLSQDWKRLYIQEHKAKKERRKLMSQIMMPPVWDPSRNFPHSPGPWLPPHPGGIIGGDYDLYPTLPNMPGMPRRGGPPPMGLPRPHYDLIGQPDIDPGPDPGLLPRPFGGRGTGGSRPNIFGGLRFF